MIRSDHASYIDYYWKEVQPQLMVEDSMPKVYSPKVQRLLDNPNFLARLRRPVKFDSKHDIPYVAGYSKDGGTVFFDRHFQPYMRVGSRYVDTRPFVALHEVGEKALLDLFGLRYQDAHHIISHVENEMVKAAGINVRGYQKFFKPQIKGIYHEKLKDIPKNLDTTPYSDEREREILESLKAGKDIRLFHHKVSPIQNRKRH